jgi:hypothetical protein
MIHNSGVLASASTETCRLFRLNETMFPPWSGIVGRCVPILLPRAA